MNATNISKAKNAQVWGPEEWYDHAWDVLCRIRDNAEALHYSADASALRRLQEIRMDVSTLSVILNRAPLRDEANLPDMRIRFEL